jgi:hypothetical protein
MSRRYIIGSICFFTKPIILFPAVIDQIKIIGDYIQNITMKDLEKMSYYCNYFKCVFYDHVTANLLEYLE